MNEISLVDVPNQNVLGIRKQGKYSMIPELLSAIYQHAMKNGAQFAGMPTFICHEVSKEAVMEADKNGTADVEVVVPVSNAVKETEQIKYYELAGGKMAKILHKGPYEMCEESYDKLIGWLIKNGKSICGPTREVYLNDPRTVGPEEILTEIYAPVKN